MNESINEPSVSSSRMAHSPLKSSKKCGNFFFLKLILSFTCRVANVALIRIINSKKCFRK